MYSGQYVLPTEPTDHGVQYLILFGQSGQYVLPTEPCDLV